MPAGDGFIKKSVQNVYDSAPLLVVTLDAQKELTTLLEKGKFDKLIFDKIVNKINKK